ncbi:MAG: hypothetical protein ACRCUE_13115 [Bosea sp. (in: a-proteobacteria)]
MASFNFSKSTGQIATAQIDFGTDVFKCILVASVPNTDNRNGWEYLSDVTNEITSADYTAGGFAVTASIGTYDTTNHRLPITFSAANPTYSAVSMSARGGIIYKVVEDSLSELEPESSPVLHFIDFGSAVSAFDGNFTVTFPTPLYINA